jgi:hypothetical protein
MNNLHELLAAIWAALEAIADGDVRLAEAILLGAVQEPPVGRPPGGWPGERGR